MKNTTTVHGLFQGAAEVAKVLRTCAFALEFFVCAVSIYCILWKPSDPAAWVPLLIAVSTLFATFLRAYSTIANGFAQRCRRISIRAYCSGRDVDEFSVATLDDDKPFLVRKFVREVTAKSLEEYYEPTKEPGEQRQTELYAHSAFYTWRILRAQAAWQLLAALLGSLVCAIGIYYLAGHDTIKVDRKAILEAISTVVLVFLTVRGFEASWNAYISYREVQALERNLLQMPQAEELKDIIDSYDIERAAGANPSSLLYYMMKTGLQSAWHSRRNNLINRA